MILQEIQALLNNNSIEPFPLDLKGVEIKIEKADRLYNFAHKNLSGLGTGDEDIEWKYFDHVLTNNYSKTFPGDCLIFFFDTKDVLKRPWPRCASYEEALVTGELILEK